MLYRFEDAVLDLDEVVAVVGSMVYLRDGREIGIGEKATDALRNATPCFPEQPQDTCGKARKTSRCSSKRRAPSALRASKAQARLLHRSS